MIYGKSERIEKKSKGKGTENGRGDVVLDETIHEGERRKSSEGRASMKG